MIYPTLTFVCDYPLCKEAFNSTESEHKPARKHAAKNGWAHHHGLDLCPIHRKAHKRGRTKASE